MKYILQIILLISLLSCNDKECCYDLVGHIDLKVVDSEGTDLLNPDNPDAYYEPKIEIKYLIEGEIVQGFNGSFEHGCTFLFQEENTDTEDYILRVYVNMAESEEYPITYIEWDDQDTDTLKFHYNRGDNYTRWDRVWYNDVEHIFNTSGERIITVVK